VIVRCWHAKSGETFEDGREFDVECVPDAVEAFLAAAQMPLSVCTKVDAWCNDTHYRALVINGECMSVELAS
jgi:hypothetical protein